MHSLAGPILMVLASADGESGSRTWAIALFFGVALGIFIKVMQHRTRRQR